MTITSTSTHLSQAYQHGQQDARELMQHSSASALASLPLAKFNNAGMRGMLLRRLLLALGRPGQALVDIASVMMRRHAAWQQFASDYFYWRGAKQTCDPEIWQRLTHGPLILMYHAVGRAGEATDRYIIPAHTFAGQMAWLSRNHFQVMSLDALMCCWREGRLPPPRAVVITFDDGYRDNFEVAYPILQQHGFTATVFLVSRYIGTANQWDKEGALAGRPTLSQEEVKTMQAGGFEIGGHSRSHRPLAALDAPDLEAEVTGCKLDLERMLPHAPVTHFAYPHGRYDNAVQDAVARAGYVSAGCSEPGVNDPAIYATSPWALRRLEVRGTDSLADFALMLAAGKNRVVSRLICSE